MQLLSYLSFVLPNTPLPIKGRRLAPLAADPRGSKPSYGCSRWSRPLGNQPRLPSCNQSSRSRYLALLRRFYFAASPTLLCVLVVVVLGGCQSMGESSPVRGAEFTARDSQTLPEVSSFLRQGDNAETPTTYRRIRSGTDTSGNPFKDETSITMGTVRDPLISLPPAADWGKYGVAIIGALAFIAGLILLKNGWPKIGAASAAGGVIAMIIALTVEQWGWAYALVVLVVFAIGIRALYSGYISGLQEGGAAASSG